MAVLSRPIRPNPTTQSRLLQLPAELRNMIWHLVLASNKPFFVPRSLRPVPRNQKHMWEATEPALAQVNHQVRDETLKMFYAENHFAFAPIYPVDFPIRFRESLVSWLKAIGRNNAKCIKTISGVFMVSEPIMWRPIRGLLLPRAWAPVFNRVTIKIQGGELGAPRR